MLKLILTQILIIVFSFKLLALDLDMVSVDAYREERDHDEQTSSSYIINSDEIAKQQATSTSKLLRDNPAIDVATQGGPGGNTSIFLRGLNSEHTMIMIDGIVVNDPSSPSRSFNIGQLDSLAIEKIEILPGSRGFLHGSDAIGGVINIVTKSPMGGKGDWRVFAGSPLNGGFSLSTEVSNDKNAAARFSLHYLKNQGVSSADEKLGNTEKDGLQKIQANIKGFHEVNSKLNFDYAFQYSHQEIELDRGGGLAQDDPNYDEIDILINSKAFFRYRPQSGHIFKGGIGHNYGNRESENLIDSFDSSESLSIFSSHRVKPEVIYEYQGKEVHVLTQADYSYEQVDMFSSFGGVTSSDNELDSNQYSISSKISNPARKRFIWEAGLRFTGNPDLESAFTYLGGIGYRFKKIKLRANISSGFKNPTLFQLFDAKFGNSTLRAETSRSLELGVEYRLSKKVQLGVTFYDIDLQDQIGFGVGYINSGELSTRGIEFNHLYRFSRNWNVSLWGNYLKLDQISLRKPESKWGAKLNYSTTKLDTQLKLRFVGERNDKDFTNNISLKLDAYTTFDLSLKYKIKKSFSIGVSVLNIADEDYTEVFGYSIVGRSFLASLEGKF